MNDGAQIFRGRPELGALRLRSAVVVLRRAEQLAGLLAPDRVALGVVPAPDGSTG